MYSSFWDRLAIMASAALVALFIVLLSSCGYAKEQEKPGKPPVVGLNYDFDCKFLNYGIQRCENAELLCYYNADKEVIVKCKFKNLEE